MDSGNDVQVLSKRGVKAVIQGLGNNGMSNGNLFYIVNTFQKSLQVIQIQVMARIHTQAV